MSDAIFVGPCALIETPRQIELRIGESRRGESRIAYLNPREAQQVALALLQEAENSLANAEKSEMQRAG